MEKELSGVEIRALIYSPETVGDVLLFVAEDGFADYQWPCDDVKAIAEAQGFKGESGQVFSTAYLAGDTGTVRRLIVVGLGKLAELELEGVRKALSRGLDEADKLKVTSLTTAPWGWDSLALKDVARALAETAILKGYRFERYHEKKKESSLKTLQLGYEEEQEVDVLAGLKVGVTLGQSTNLARDLVNEPGNQMTPAQLAQAAQQAGEEYGFEVEVFEEKASEELGMEAFLAVGRASVNRPRLIVMRYFGKPDKPDEVLGYVGKGITFDSGGLSLKPAGGMAGMKYDMAGSAAVIGAMSAIAREKLPLNVVAVVAACENLVSSTGYRPGDIIGSMAGKTILIESTDAEGRLTLADAVHYIIEKEKVNTVVDIATLTGAAIVALGNTTTGVVTNDQKLYEKMQAASEQCGERIWQLPSFPEYREQNKTPFADLKNTGGRPAGTVTAGLFIEAFVQDKPWIHLDIAGTASASKPRDYLAEGATGVGVRLLYHFAGTFI